MTEILVTARDQIPPGEGRTFLVAGTPIAIFHTHHGEVYATQSQCPHRSGPLGDGLVGGTTIVCPLHDRAFDLKTGCGMSHENMSIAVYPVRVAGDGEIWLDPVAAPAPEAAG